MGVEAYGLVGFFATLQSLLVLFDLGMSTTVTRELARYSSLLGREQEIRDLTRTLEMIYWSIGGFIAIIVLLLSEIIGLY
jgi:O-antigen/teichoic acid export membrane protein